MVVLIQSEDIAKVIATHLLGTMNVCTKFHGGAVVEHLHHYGPKWGINQQTLTAVPRATASRAHKNTLLHC